MKAIDIKTHLMNVKSQHWSINILTNCAIAKIDNLFLTLMHEMLEILLGTVTQLQLLLKSVMYVCMYFRKVLTRKEQTVTNELVALYF